MISFTDSHGNVFKLEEIFETFKALKPRFEIRFVKSDDTILFKLMNTAPSNFAAGQVIKHSGSEYGIIRIVYDFDTPPADTNHMAVVNVHLVERSHSALCMETCLNG